MADDTTIPEGKEELIGADVELQLMDPDYLALLTERFGEESQRTGTLWNYFMYGVDYDPNEEVWVDKDGNIVDREQMRNPDYVEGSTEQVKNPAYEEYNRTYDTEGSEPYNPPPEYITQETAGQGEEYIDDPSITRTTLGDVKGYKPEDYISEAELSQMTIQAEGGLLPERTAAESAALTASTATSNLETASVESALRLLPIQEQSALLRAIAENAGNKLTEAEALSQLRTLPEEERTRLLMLQAEQSGYDLTKATNEMGLRLLPEQEGALSAGYKADIAKAELSEDQSRRAQEIIDYGKKVGLDEAQIDAQLSEAGLSKEQADYAKELLGYRKSTGVDTAAIDLEKQTIGDKSTALTQKGGIRQNLYDQLQSGLDVNAKAKQAAADAAAAYDKSKEGLFTSLALRGVAPNVANTNDSMNRASLISTAKTKARNDAEKTNISNLATGLQIF